MAVMTTMTTAMAWAQVCTRRLDRHGLSAPLSGGPAEVVSAVAGTHAQVLSSAELSIALRLPDATRATVQAALWETRELVKTFGPRGTVHLLPAAELPAWTAALAIVPMRSPAASDPIHMTCEQTEQVLAAIEDAVHDAELTIDELSDAVVAATGSWSGDPVMEAFQGKWARCAAGRSPTRRRRRRAAPPADPVAWLLRRYLYAFGPATPARFANWLTVPDAWARQVFESADLSPVLVDGENAWVSAGDTEGPTEPPRGLRLLPYFDTYAYAVGNDRARLNPGLASTRAKGNFQVLLADGVVGGLWHRKRSGKRVALTVEPFIRMTMARRAELDEQVERVGTILGATPELTIGEVTVGGHA